MKKRNGFTLFKFACISLIIMGLSSCFKSGTNVATATPRTYISVLHLAPYAPAVEIYLNDAKSSAAINPNTYFNAYSQVDPGSYDIKFKKASGDSLVAEVPTYEYDSLTFYTILLYNHGQTSTNAITIRDDFSNVSSTTGSYYRFFNMNPDGGPVDLYLNNTLSQSGRTPADNVNNGNFNRFQGIGDGYYNVQVKAAGTDSLVASATSVSLSIGNVYTFLLTGKGTMNTISVLQGAY